MLQFKIVRQYFCIVLFLISANIQAQTDFASIRKNINVLANGLEHDLNRSKDTLLLKSGNLIHRVYTVGENGGIIDIKVNGNEQKIPLRNLPKGTYVIVVDQDRLKIVFQVHILEDSWTQDAGVLGEVARPTDPILESNSKGPSVQELTTDVIPKNRINESDGLVSSTSEDTGKQSYRQLSKAFSTTSLKSNKNRNSGRSAKDANLESNEKPGYKPYNLTDIGREGVQSRAEARRSLKLNNVIRRLEIQAKLKDLY